METKVRDNKFLITLLMIFILKGIIYAVYITPLLVGVAPDDVGHISYIQYLLVEKQFPVRGEVGLEKQLRNLYFRVLETYQIGELNVEYKTQPYDFGMNNNGENWIAQHPPLYYILATIIYGIISVITSNFYIALIGIRLLSILYGVIALVYIFKIGELLELNLLQIKMMGILFTFFAPIQFYFANVTNDSLLMCLCIVTLYYLMKFLENYLIKDYYLMVIGCAAIIWTKYTGGLAVIAYILIFIYKILKYKGIKELINLGVKGGILGGLLLAPLIGFNILNYGRLVSSTGTSNISDVYDFSFYTFIVEKGYLREIFDHLITLIGWTTWTRSSDLNIVIVTIILSLSAIIGIRYYYPNKIMTRVSMGTGVLSFIMLYLLKSGVMISICGASLIMIIVKGIFDTMIPYKYRELMGFMTIILIVTILIFAKQHYSIGLHRGVPGATHGRYYYISIYPFMYLITNCLLGIKNNKKGGIGFLGILVLLIISEGDVIIRSLEAWRWVVN